MIVVARCGLYSGPTAILNSSIRAIFLAGSSDLGGSRQSSAPQKMPDVSIVAVEISPSDLPAGGEPAWLDRYSMAN